MGRSDSLTAGLTTGTCARILGDVTTNYVRGEIRDKRIAGAIEFTRPSGRKFYRVPVESLRAYCETFAPGALPRLEQFEADLRRAAAA